MDEVTVKLGMTLSGTAKLFHEILQLLPGFFRHSRIGLPLFFIQVHGLAVQLQFFLRLLAVLLQLLLPLHLFPGLLTHLLFGNKEAVENTVKGQLFFP